MAKINLKWFKLDCQTDDKLDLVEAEFGLTGFAVVVKLFMKIYGGEGYYCEWNDDVALVFARKNGVGANAVSEIVSAALRRGIFEDRLYKKYGILTSHGIQARYLDCVERRKGEKIKPEYLLVQCTQKSENVSNSSENVYISDENVYKNEQKKNRKEKDKNRLDKKREDTYVAYGEHGRVPLTESEYAELVGMSSCPVVEKYIKKMDLWSFDSGKQIKNAFERISQWIECDGKAKPKADNTNGKGGVEERARNFNPNTLGFEEDDD